MNEKLSMPVVADFIGDAADCMLNALETLRAVEKSLNTRGRETVREIIKSLEHHKTRLHSLKGEVHSQAFAPVCSAFPQGAGDSARLHAICSQLADCNF